MSTKPPREEDVPAEPRLQPRERGGSPGKGRLRPSLGCLNALIPPAEFSLSKASRRSSATWFARRTASPGWPTMTSTHCCGKSGGNPRNGRWAACMSMPDHIHYFAGFTGSPVEFANWVRYWKSQFTKRHKASDHRWQTDDWDIRMRTWQQLRGEMGIRAVESGPPGTGRSPGQVAVSGHDPRPPVG